MWHVIDLVLEGGGYPAAVLPTACQRTFAGRFNNTHQGLNTLLSDTIQVW
jgi:hypothetical protein